MQWFKRFKKNKSYSDKKRELEIREELYSRMQSLSDNQMDKWVKVRLELQNLKSEKGSVIKMVKNNAN